MKTLLLIIAFLLIQIELIAQCPPGFQGPSTVTVEICPGCFIEANWCCTTTITPFGERPSIHFSDFLLSGTCSCIPWTTYNDNPVPVVPWELLIKAVLNSGELCFESPLLLPPCDPAPPASYNIIVQNGGCYSVTDIFEKKKYTPCEITGEARCYEYYKICVEYVNGQPVLKVEGLGKQAAFNCIDPYCFPLCY
jgi:hypothetical protein